MSNTKPLYPLAFKPDLADAARRWDAFYAGDIVDRPVIYVTAPKGGPKPPAGTNYRDRVFGDLDEVIDRIVANAEATYYAGEAIPTAWLSFGPDEVACFCGATLGWSDASGDTNWVKPFVADWADALPLRLHEEGPLWQRMLEFYRRALPKTAGKMLLDMPDWHTNMDLLMAVRGSQNLCLDLYDAPEMIDRAMADARAIFRRMWRAVADAGLMDQRGYCHGMYSMEGAAGLQCDFSCMMSPAMFRRWVLPALEEEAALSKHVTYHWDGPNALVHEKDLIAARGLHTLSFVPGDGHGTHIDYLDMLHRVQAGGKAVHVWGSGDQLKELHRHLRPEKTMYHTSCRTPAEADALLEWFVKNT